MATDCMNGQTACDMDGQVQNLMHRQQTATISFERITNPEDNRLKSIYGLLAETFDASVLDSFDVVRNELQAGAGKTTPPYIIIAAFEGNAPMSLIVGGYMGNGFGTIDYAATGKEYRRLGLAKLLVVEFEKVAQRCALEDGQVLKAVIIEGQQRSDRFWDTMGYSKINTNHPQPPMQYDTKTGEPICGDGILRIKPFTAGAGNAEIRRSATSVLYRNWYSQPSREEFETEEAYLRAANCVNRLIEANLNSISPIYTNEIPLKSFHIASMPQITTH